MRTTGIGLRHGRTGQFTAPSAAQIGWFVFRTTYRLSARIHPLFRNFLKGSLVPRIVVRSEEKYVVYPLVMSEFNTV